MCGRVHPTGICTPVQLQVCACNDMDVLCVCVLTLAMHSIGTWSAHSVHAHPITHGGVMQLVLKVLMNVFVVSSRNHCLTNPEQPERHTG